MKIEDVQVLPKEDILRFLRGVLREAGSERDPTKVAAIPGIIVGVGVFLGLLDESAEPTFASFLSMSGQLAQLCNQLEDSK